MRLITRAENIKNNDCHIWYLKAGNEACEKILFKNTDFNTKNIINVKSPKMTSKVLFKLLSKNYVQLIFF